MTDATISPLARALGRVPSGLYVVSSLDGDTPVGFVGSFVMQMGFAPPTVCVAIGKERGPLAAFRAHGHFALSIIDDASKGLMAPFFKPAAEGATPFDGLATGTSEAGCPVLTDALAWLGCRISSEHETMDHVVVFGEVTEGEVLREGDPAQHVRKNGLGY